MLIQGINDRTNIVQDSLNDVNGASSEEIKMNRWPRKMYLAAFSALMFGVALGTASAYSATATEDMKKSRYIKKPTNTEISWIGSLVALGALFGGLIAGYLSDKFGRKGALLLSSLPFMVGWYFIAFAKAIPFIYVGRLITGLCVGLVCATVPAYLVEISTPEVRGLMGTSFQLFVVIGVLIVTCLGSIISWNWLAIASSSIITIAVAMFCWMPESPRYLVMKGKHREAVSAVKFLQGPGFDAEAEVVGINEDLCNQPKGKLTLRELMKPMVYKPALLAIGLVFFQQATGSNAILFYTVNIFKSGKSSLNPNVESIIIDAVLVLATAISSVIIDKTGRKILLLISSIGMGISLCILGAYEYANAHNSLTGNYSWLPLVCLIVYIAAFSIGFGPITWLMVAELSPSTVRGFIGGLATCICWLCVFIVTQTFEGLSELIHIYGAYWVYSGFSALACVFIIMCLPETKGKTFDQIQEFFQ